MTPQGRSSSRIGDTVSDALTEDDADFVGTYYDLYTFEGRAGDLIAIFMSGDLREAVVLDTFIRLIPEGAPYTVLAEDDDSGGGLNAQVDFTLPADGTYWIIASTPYQDTYGGYALRLEKKDPAAQGAARGVVPITPGEVVQGELTGLDTTNAEGSPYDLYSFQAVAGQEVRITLRSSEFDTYLSLFDATDPDDGIAFNDDGAMIDGSRGTDSEIVYPIRFDGEYLIRAGSFYAGSRGQYRLNLTIP